LDKLFIVKKIYWINIKKSRTELTRICRINNVI